MAGAATSAAWAVRDVLRNRAIGRVELAWTAGTAADWAFLVVLLVVAYDEGGTLAVGILGAVRVLPAIVAAPFATSLVNRFPGERVLTSINLLRCVGAFATAAVLGLDLPIAFAYVLAAVVAGVGSLVRPIQNALLPSLARTPGELVASNVASSVGEGVGTFTGPLVAGVLVASTGSVEASVLVAATFAGAAAAVTGVHFDSAPSAPGRWTPPPVRVRDVAELLRTYPVPALVAGDFVAQVFVRGMLVALTVALSIELLDLGDGGVGLLNAALGLGGLAGGLGALGLAGGKRLGVVFVIALACWGVPLVLVGLWPVAALALVGLAVTGVSNAVLDVSGFTLVQRGVREEHRVAMFSVMESLFGIGLLAGSLAAPAAAGLVGTRGALGLAGLLLPLCAALTWRPITRGAVRDRRDEQRVALLRRNELFQPLPLTALDRLVEGMEPRSFAAGDVVMRKGERGDHYLVIEQGEIEVRDGDRILSTLGPGDGVGEIALVRDVPRTATAVARSPVAGYAIGASAFLAAVAGPAAAAAAERVISARLEKSRGGPSGGDGR